MWRFWLRSGVSTATGSGLFAFLGSGSRANFQADRLYKSSDTFKYKCGGIKAYKKGRGLASVCWRMSLSWTLYVATKTSHIPRNLNLLGETTLLGGIFCVEYPSRHSEKVNCHFLNYRLSSRKLKIVISQTTDCHFTNYRLSFRKLQIFILQTADFHFANSRVSFRKLQIFISFHFILFRSISFRKLALEHFCSHSLWFYRWINNRMMEHS